ncbi:expressed unknown protein [Seminavis robusta]|uniref:Uncharacterized protein n=1 Tax=Seminavis robusta TaxID=568900 RepID=A0A9N8DJ09_9STRA|nr:expressed unknown protein [Seminavis robusta]|eukprot:Sro109_g054540.1 n/a (511) ;mRNA; f:60142-61674
MSGQPFKTKFTIGLLTIDPCPQEEHVHTDEDYLSNDVNAHLSAEELAARDAIKARKGKKKRNKSGDKGVSRQKSGDSVGLPPPEPINDAVAEQVRLRMEAKKKAKAEKARKAAEEDAAIKAEAEATIAAEMKEKEEEEARVWAAKRLAEEEAKKAEEIRLRHVEEQRREEERKAEEIRLRHVEEQAKQAKEPSDDEASLNGMIPSLGYEEPLPEKPRTKQRRRVSFFPATADNSGLDDALRNYNNDVPFDWENPEWTKEFVDLRHTTQQSLIYGWEKPDWTVKRGLRAAQRRSSKCGWEKPDWAKKSILRKTDRLDDLMSDTSGRTSLGGSMDGSLMRRHSFCFRGEWDRPSWAKRNVLKKTEAGSLIRKGANLAIPITEIKARMDPDSTLHDSVDSLNQSLNMSMNLSQKNIDWEKPAWAKGAKLRKTEAGQAARQGVNLNKSGKGPEAAGGEASAASLNASVTLTQKNIGWEKPSWASNPNLKRTSTGEKMKTTGTLAKPIIFRGNEK